MSNAHLLSVLQTSTADTAVDEIGSTPEQIECQCLLGGSNPQFGESSSREMHCEDENEHLSTLHTGLYHRRTEAASGRKSLSSYRCLTQILVGYLAAIQGMVSILQEKLQERTNVGVVCATNWWAMSISNGRGIWLANVVALEMNEGCSAEYHWMGLQQQSCLCPCKLLDYSNKRCRGNRPKSWGKIASNSFFNIKLVM